MSLPPNRVAPQRIVPEQIAIHRLFATPLAQIAYPAANRLNDMLKEEIARHRVEDPAGVRHSNSGGWQSSPDFNTWDGEGAMALTAYATELASALTAVYHPEYGLVVPEFEWKVNAWANVNNAGDSNAQHAHPGAFWSGVYWVDDGRDDGQEAGGDLQFLDPRGVMPSLYNPELKIRVAGCLSAGLTTSIAAESGTLVMFPSWLLHSVTAFTGSRPRISVAFNFSA
ncbi:TIGR02466 family protein [Xanthomonas sacchari]|uniref:TIGR02466 family protein n=1 Tax=Xanthomonas sacchari TaxID=56458 RepID=UPI003526EEA3